MKEKAIEMMNAVYRDDENQKKKIEDTREAFAIVTQFILENMKDSCEKSLVLTKLEEGVYVGYQRNYKRIIVL